MPFEYQWNRLKISSKAAGEFLALFDEAYENLLGFEYDVIELDLVANADLSEEALQHLVSSLDLCAAIGKRLILRLPSTVESRFNAEMLPKSIQVEFVNVVQGTGSESDSRLRTGKRATSRRIPANGEAESNTGRRTINSRGETSVKPTDKADKLGQENASSQTRNNSQRIPPKNSDESTNNRIRGRKTDSWLSRAWLQCVPTGEVREIREEIMVGRAPDNDWVFDEPTLSKRHFRIVLRQGRYQLQDLDSTNGTFLNYLKIGGLPVTLVADDLITVSVTDDRPEGTVTFNLLDACPGES